MIYVAEQSIHHSFPVGLIKRSRCLCKKFIVVLICWKLGCFGPAADEAL